MLSPSSSSNRQLRKLQYTFMKSSNALSDSPASFPRWYSPLPAGHPATAMFIAVRASFSTSGGTRLEYPSGLGPCSFVFDQASSITVQYFFMEGAAGP